MKLLSLLILTALATAVGILVMIHGWGLTPQSWAVIIGGAMVQLGLLIVTGVLGRSDG